MASIQNYLDQISGARYGKDVRASIVNALDAVNKDANYTEDVSQTRDRFRSWLVWR